MVKIPETHTPSSISLGRNTPDSLDAVGSKINNPFADAIDTLGAGLNMFGKTLDREQKVKAAEAERQRVAKLKAAEDAQKEVWSSQSIIWFFLTAFLILEQNKTVKKYDQTLSFSLASRFMRKLLTLKELEV